LAKNTTYTKLPALSLWILSRFLLSGALSLGRLAVCFVLNRISPRTACGMLCLSPSFIVIRSRFPAHLHLLLKTPMSGNLNFIVIFIPGKNKQRASFFLELLYRAIWRPKVCKGMPIKAMCLH